MKLEPYLVIEIRKIQKGMENKKEQVVKGINLYIPTAKNQPIVIQKNGVIRATKEFWKRRKN